MVLLKNFSKSKHVTNNIENIHQSFNKYVRSTDHGPGTVLGTGDRVENTTDNPPTPMELTV